jgi:hypothetical protein
MPSGSPTFDKTMMISIMTLVNPVYTIDFDLMAGFQY